MSLAKWAAKNGPEMLSKVKKFAIDNKKPLMAAAAIPAAVGAYEVGQPMVDDFMSDQALKSVGRSAKRGLADTLEFAEEHPYISSALLGASGLAGAKLGDDNFSDVFNAVSPVKLPGRGRANGRTR